MARTICKLDGTYKELVYHAAFPLDSTIEVAKVLIYIGIGRIVAVNGKPYNNVKKFKFYKMIRGWKE